jgi:hypothetical protein
MLGEGKGIADVCRELAVAEQTYYRRRNQFGGLKADDAKRPRVGPTYFAHRRRDAVISPWATAPTGGGNDHRAGK